MEKRSDYIVYGNTEEISLNLKFLSNKLEIFADEISTKTNLSYASRIFPNILRCISRQLIILEASLKLPIEVAAGACRIVFEINLRTRILTMDNEKIKEFGIERVYEEISLIKSFKKLAEKDTNPKTIAPLDERIIELQNLMNKWKVEKPEHQSTAQLAKKAGLEKEYEYLYGFYSKYTHGTAWLVNSKTEEHDGHYFRNIFLVQTQFYAGESFKRIQDYLSRHNDY